MSDEPAPTPAEPEQTPAPEPDQLLLPPTPGGGGAGGGAGEPEPRSADDFLEHYRRSFLRGLATVLPTVLTMWILFAAFDFMDGTIAVPISSGIKAQLIETDWGNRVTFAVYPSLGYLSRAEPDPVPEGLSQAEREAFLAREQERLDAVESLRRAGLRRELDRVFPEWVGFLLAAVAVFVVGFFMASFFGSWLWGLGENWAARVPLINKVYPGAKQMVNFFLSNEGTSNFQAVVAIEFPRQGLWTIGFLTAENIPEVEAQAGEKVRGVYLGTPAAGQIMLAPQSSIVAVDMTVDEGLKFLISGGVIGRDPHRPRRTPKLPWETETTPS